MHLRAPSLCSIAAAVIGAAVLFADGARADYDDEDAGGTAVVVQDREFRMAHEFTLGSGTLPLDAFYKGVALHGNYTLHFDDVNAWEIVDATYAFNIDAGLGGILRDRFNVQAEDLPELLLVLQSNYVFTPFYGKFALFNRAIVHQQISLIGGATVSYWSDGSFRPGPDFGAILRFFVTDWFSLRFDVRHAFAFNGIPIINPEPEIDGVLFIGAGASFNVGGGG